jgi:hypothetical protein
MIDDPVAKCLDTLAAELRRRPAGRNWIDEFLSGEILRSDQAAVIADVSPETIRRRCEAAALTNRHLGVLIAGSVWLVSREGLLDWIELREGKPARLAAATRAEKLTVMWSSPQETPRGVVAATC